MSSTENGIIFGNIGEYQSIVCYYSCVSFTQKSGNFCQNVKFSKGGTKFPTEIYHSSPPSWNYYQVKLVVVFFYKLGVLVVNGQSQNRTYHQAVLLPICTNCWRTGFSVYMYMVNKQCFHFRPLQQLWLLLQLKKVIGSNLVGSLPLSLDP